MDSMFCYIGKVRIGEFGVVNRYRGMCTINYKGLCGLVNKDGNRGRGYLLVFGLGVFVEFFVTDLAEHFAKHFACFAPEDVHS
jgi:hypothetical protein